MQHGHTATKQLKYKYETPTLMVLAGNIKKTTTLCLPTYEEWRQATSEDNYLGYSNNILSCPEETLIYPKE